MTVSILQGDALDRLRDMPDESVNACITSPPYFGLRDYGIDGQVGLEETPEMYIEKLVLIFREVRRVLRNDGTLWLNLGDSYYNYRPGGHERRQTIAGQKSSKNVHMEHPIAPSKRNRKYEGIKEKDLIGIPWMAAFALRADGWYLRQDNIWNKPNCMPESVEDRTTRCHEYFFMLSKSRDYYYDHEAIKEDAQDWSTGGPGAGIKETQHYGAGNGGNDGLSKLAQRYKAGGAEPKRNKRSVWTVPTQAFKGAHFATFPPDLIEPCILAGPDRGGGYS